MRPRIALATMALLASTSIATGCGRSHDTEARTPAQNAPATASGEVAPATSAPPVDSAPKHHSKLAGALVGAAAGHAMGHHALAGAAAGALVQHERNKHHR